MLRSAAKTVSTALVRTRTNQLQQTRNLGDLPVKPNKYIEDWGTKRENLEKEFILDGKALQRIVIWAFGFPLVCYNITCAEMVKCDQIAGRPVRKFWGYN